MVETFFEFQSDIDMSCGAPQESGASNGRSHVGRSRGVHRGGVSWQKNFKSLRLSGFSSKSTETLPDHSWI